MQYVSARPGGNAAAATMVTGATRDRNPDGRPRLITGPVSMDHSVQDEAKLKLGVGLGEHTTAVATLGLWRNRSDLHGTSTLRDADGNVITSGPLRADEQTWTLSPTAFAASTRDDTQRLLGLQLDGRFGDDWHWSAIASDYDYVRSRQNNALQTGRSGPGTLADNGGSGWQTVDLRASGPWGSNHTLSVSAHADRYALDSRVHAASDWRGRRPAAQRQTDVTVTPTVTRVQNIGRVRIQGIESALQWRDLWVAGFDLSGSIALNDSETLRDRAYPAAQGHDFPRMPRVRAKLTADWRFAERWQVSLDGRRSGRQYGSLDNSDHIDTFGAISSFTVFDAKLRWQLAPQSTASLGVSNLTNRRYWVYHPWPARTWLATLRWNAG